MNINTIKEAMDAYEPEGFYDWMAGYVAALSDQEDDGWIAHRGGKMPVDGLVNVQVKTRDRGVCYTPIEARRWNWSYDQPSSGDIIAYRIIL